MKHQIGAVFSDAGCDALLITDAHNMRHLSGFTGGTGALFLTADRRVLITDSRYTEAAGRESDFEVIEENRDHRRAAIIDAGGGRASGRL